jgi:hypothetical protein
MVQLLKEGTILVILVDIFKTENIVYYLQFYLFPLLLDQKIDQLALLI